MKNRLIAMAVSLVAGGLAYLVLDDLYIGLAVVGVFLLSTVFLIAPVFTRYQRKAAIIHQAYRFVNNFIVSLSITNSGETAYAAACEGVSDPTFKEITARIDTMSAQERIEYLASYFDAPFYPMFLSVYSIYSEQGGDCLTVADPLLKEITRDEEHTRKMRKDSRKVLAQFAIFWVMSAFIIGFLRYGLSGYYETMLHSKAFRIIGVSFFAIALASFFIFARVYTGLPFQVRFRHEEK